MIMLGKPAPKFNLEAYENGEIKKITSEDYKGKWLVLNFYPRDFTFVCPTELKALARYEDEFKEQNAVILAASTDSVNSHKAWIESELKEVKYPVLADTSHSLSKNYNVLIEEEGKALRGTFIIDPEGILQYSVVSNLDVGRSTDEILRVLQALQTKELCPVNWKPGDKTLGG
ncbi:peroxiredoxin [Candidatus Woesearchaeota archaeon]|nr:peroxiredoxin [Candidatus Woesearchaeota archaeon]